MLTREQIENLSGRELDAAVAEMMGWTAVRFETAFGRPGHYGVGTFVGTPPDSGGNWSISIYHADIAAAYDMEAHLPKDKRSLYCGYLEAIVFDETQQRSLFDVVHATPEQRCRAALLAVQKEV